MNNTKYEVRPVVGYEGKYSVSNTGQVFSLNFNRTGQTRKLKPRKNSDGYLRVVLYQEGKANDYFTHHLVLETFKGNPDNKTECDHIDGNKTNNHISNLRWVTRTENMNNPITRKKKSAAVKGKNNPKYDTTIYKFRNKNTGEEFSGTQYDFRTKYDLDQGNVYKLIKGRINHHKKWILL